MAPDRHASLSRDQLVRGILGAPPEFTAEQVAGQAEVDLDLTRRLWRALGFPEFDEGEVAFTDTDAAALRLVQKAIDSGLVDVDTALNLTRAAGTTMARLADWELATLAPQATAGEAPGEDRLEATVRLLDLIGEPLERLMVYAWRRHMAAAVARIEAVDPEDEEVKTTEVTVGFADIVAFTALSNQIGEERIGDMVEIFETRCHDVVSTNHGRVIKSLGDSVLFVCAEPFHALDITHGIIAVIGRDPRMPDVRVGLASGSVATRMGDVFGPAVNLAARLTAVARRNRVIIDEATAAMLPAEDYDVRRLPARPLRGFGLVEPIAVRPR